MRPISQARILCWLGKFSKDLEFEWDVPRDISLPGISEALGVVRSALHKPLNQLENENLVKSRTAHVIGGGTRKRKVYHLTKKGIEEFIEIQEDYCTPVDKKKFTLYGQFPQLVEVIGRTKIKDKIIENLVKRRNILLVGMAGIGKSALSRNMIEDLLQNYNVRWDTITKFSDVESITRTWSGESNVPSEYETAAKWVCDKFSQDLLVLDELQEIHERHLENIIKMLEYIRNSPDSPMILLISRAPAPIDKWYEIRIEGLDNEEAAKLLDNEISLEDRINISKILGGHPLALQIAGASSEIPEKSKDIQQFISENILSQIEDSTINALDELAALSIPINSHLLGIEDEIGNLDERALVRWVMEENDISPSKIELQHLIRNVRRAQWSDAERKKINLKIAQNLSRFEDGWIKCLELHHRINSDDDNLETWVDENIETIENTESAILSVVLNDAIDARPEIENLWIIATKVAINRGEKVIAENLLKNAIFSKNRESQWLEVKSRLCRLNGNEVQAIKLMKDAISIAEPLEKTKIKVAEISRKIVDRLPFEKIDGIKQIKQMISEIDTTILSGQEKKTLIVTIAILKHTIAIIENDWESARSIKEDLTELTNVDDPLIWEMECRERLHIQNGLDFNLIEKMMDDLGKIKNPIRRCGILLTIIEKVPDEFKKTVLESITKEVNALSQINNNQNSKRIIGLRWYWVGLLHPEEKLIAWQECAKNLQAAECIKASKKVVNKLHDLLN